MPEALFIVELETGVFISQIPGGPGRTLVKENARRYVTSRGARIALGHARRFRPFTDARIEPVEKGTY